MILYKYVCINAQGRYHSVDSAARDIWVKRMSQAMLHDTRDDAEWVCSCYPDEKVKVRRLKFELTHPI